MTFPIEDLLGENQPIISPPTLSQDEQDAAFDIVEGAGTGSLDVDTDFRSRVKDTINFVTAGLIRQEMRKKDDLYNLEAAFWNGNLTQKEVIAELMALKNLDYDEADAMLAKWITDRGGVFTAGEDELDAVADLDSLLAEYGLGGALGGSRGGGSRSGGSAVRTYAGPDSGLVEDWVKSKLVTLVGKASGDRIKMLTNEYFTADRKAFGGESIDPKQTVLEKIRTFDDYTRIHELRSDAQDEDTWISGQMSQLLNAGVSGQQAEELAIDFAQAGVAQARAGELSEARRIGTAPVQALPGFFNKMRGALSVAARSLR